MKKKVAIIGGGASALILACELNPHTFEVSVYEKNAALGRKFLVAGEGGLNFTHSENQDNFIKRFTPSTFLQEAFFQNNNSSYVEWMNTLGIETFVGTSGRLFPKKGIKPIQVLEKILEKIEQNKVKLYYRHVWEGFSDKGNLKISNTKDLMEVRSDLTIFCLGGASWPVTGSDGAWVKHFKAKHIQVNTFQASNCSFVVNWEASLASKIEGKSIKNCSFSCGNKTHLGEVVLTKTGIEGSGIYPLSPEIRDEIAEKGMAEINIDLKPSLSLEKILEKLRDKSSQKNTTDLLRFNIHLSETQIALLKNALSKEEFLKDEFLAKRIKKLTVNILALAPVEEAISSIGGISLEEIDQHFELRKMKGSYVIGEMLDYDAPTGGYLLQSCFSMAKYVATHLNTAFSD